MDATIEWNVPAKVQPRPRILKDFAGRSRPFCLPSRATTASTAAIAGLVAMRPVSGFSAPANSSLLLGGQPIRQRLPPIEDQLLPALELSREIGERPFLRGNDALDLSDRFGAFQRIFLAAEAVNFEATIVRHHVLKAEMRQPAELQ